MPAVDQMIVAQLSYSNTVVVSSYPYVRRIVVVSLTVYATSFDAWVWYAVVDVVVAAVVALVDPSTFPLSFDREMSPCTDTELEHWPSVALRVLSATEHLLPRHHGCRTVCHLSCDNPNCHMDNLGVHLRHFYLGSRVTGAV